jgi:integrase/recombinase XerD
MSARLPRAPETFEQLVLAFVTDLEQERGLARNTVNAYRGDLHQFGAFLAHRRRDALAVEPAELAAFVEELANSQAGKTPLAAATLQRKIAVERRSISGRAEVFAPFAVSMRRRSADGNECR